MNGPTKTLTEERHLEVFAALVAAPDGGGGGGPSRREVAAFERDGVDNDWPPL